MKQKKLRKQAFYRHPPEAVWLALTDARALAEWLMPNDFRPERGHTFRFMCDRHPGDMSTGCVDCEVLEIDPPRRMVWAWQNNPKNPNRSWPPMRITWTLAPEAGGTRLTLEQTGLEGQPWLITKMMAFGWGTMLKRWLPKVLGNVSQHDGSATFQPGAIPLDKRCYRCRTIPDDLVR